MATHSPATELRLRDRLVRTSILLIGAGIFGAALFFHQSSRGEIQRLGASIEQRWQKKIVSANPLTEEDLAGTLTKIRKDENLSALMADEQLRTASRVLAMHILDRQSAELSPEQLEFLQQLDIPDNSTLSTLTLFVPAEAHIDLEHELRRSPAATAAATQRVGFGLIPGTLMRTSGHVVVLTFLTPNAQPSQPKPPDPPDFTSEELWDAVQVYRQSHNLFLFEKHDDLCTLAQARADEIVAAGKLDNHAGFAPRSDAFFADHVGWTSLNENLASGYATAVQTVEWGWDHSLGHQALLKSREYPKACAVAEKGFAVLITGK